MSNHGDWSTLLHTQKDILAALEKNHRMLKWIFLVVIVALVVSVITFAVAFSR
ncbi:MAG: hypothetical protein Q8R76_00410 [Candidatus Omnitrophota bacterium]|nr:hypothetical protein [Candidatus Omnitrophota bacterium]